MMEGGRPREGWRSVMASDMNRMNRLLTKDNPHLVSVHYVCHRLNLAVLQACTGIEGIADMAALQSVLAAV